MSARLRLIQSHLNSLSHCRLILSLEEWNWHKQADLHQKLKKKESTGEEWFTKPSPMILTCKEKATTRLTPSLLQPVHFLSWKVHTEALHLLFVLRDDNKPAFNAAYFEIKMSTCWWERSFSIFFFFFCILFPSIWYTRMHSSKGVKAVNLCLLN